MILWSLALIVTAIACAALYYAGARARVNAGTDNVDRPEVEHLRRQLREIETDAEAGRIGEAEVLAARGEVARELIRVKALERLPASRPLPRIAVVASVAATAMMALGIYAALGRPDMPALPMATCGVR